MINKVTSFGKWLAGRQTVLESGYARVRRIMFGDVPEIRTIGIVTAQNPYGQPPWPDNDIESGRENRDRNQSLEQYLRIRNFGPVKVKGRFGLYEDSFLIPNIAREELVSIGRWFDQEAVIWGRKEIDQFNHPYFRFEYIGTQSGRTQSVCTVHIGSSDVQGREDYYSMIGGRKFVIPFFDDPHARKVPGRKLGTVADVPDTAATPWTADELADRMLKAESFIIPFFDQPAAELILDGRVNEITYYSERLPNTSVVRQLVEDIQRNAEAVFADEYADSRAKRLWHHRGIIRECLWKLNRL